MSEEHAPTSASRPRPGFLAVLSSRLRARPSKHPSGSPRGEGAAKGTWPLRAGAAAAAAVIALCLTLSASTAGAAPTVIASQGVSAGQVEAPVGTAVDQSSGDLYVADRNNFRIDKFGPDGLFLLAWGFGVADGKSLELQVCGPQVGHPRCFHASSNEATAPGSVAPEAVAVDNDAASTSFHDVYVVDRPSHRLTKFSPSGEFIFMVGKGVDQGGGTPSHPGNICTAEYLDNGDVCGSGEKSGTGAGEFFGSPTSAAVDAEGHVWVGDSGRIIELDSAGGFISEAPVPGGGEAVMGLAIDPASGDLYLKSALLAGIRCYALSGAPPAQTLIPACSPIDEAGKAKALALDSASNLFVGDATSPYRLLRYEAGALTSLFGAGQVITNAFGRGPEGNALAVDEAGGAHYLYVASSLGGELSAVQRFDLPKPGPLVEAQHAEALEPTSATLAASLNPEGHETTYRFQYGTSEAYGQSTEAKTLPAGYEGKAVKAPLEGLIPETTYHFRLLAENEKGVAEGEDTTFATRPAVAIEAQWASEVAARSATLHATVDPLGGAEGRWWIEYGTSPAYGSQTAKSTLPQSFGELSLATAFSGLDPATTYHYRFAASDEREVQEGGETVKRAFTVHGPDRGFTTQLAGLGFTLADARAWEMVSPAQKHGGLIAIGAQGEGHMQAAADGDALAYLSMGSIEASPQGATSPERASVLSRRSATGSWSSEDLAPPNERIAPVTEGLGFEYRLFSSDFSKALLEPRSGTPLSPAASERAPYLRENASPPAYAPLLSGCPKPPAPCPPEVEANADVGPGIEFGVFPDQEALTASRSAAQIEGATPDLAHVVLHSEVPLAEGDAKGSLYEWSAAAPPAERLAPISVPPAGEHAVKGELGSRQHSVRGAIAAGGSRVFWSTIGGGGEPSGLYLRDTTLGQSVRLDTEQPGSFGTGKAEPIFQGANPAGTVALFTDTQNLTEDANEAGADLYRWRAEGTGSCEEAEGCLEDLTAPTLNPEDPFESAEVQGIAAGIAEDGTRVYFVAKGVLATNTADYGAGPAQAVPGQPNLYLWQQGEGTRFIATLSEEDEHDWGRGYEPAAQQSAAASPSGRYLAFMSQNSLTGYDNRDAGSGEADQEVFRYDAEANGGEGELICASCNPSGARPAGVNGYTVPGTAPFYDPQEIWRAGQGLAAVLPDATKLGVLAASLYRSRSIQDDGRLFFNSADPLVAADSNGSVWDVYEYEPQGQGTCAASSGDAATARSAGGCVSLISSGSAEGEAAFLDASERGTDVFFFSPARLSVDDEDGVTDVYDARTEGVPARLEPRAECLGEACQPAVSAPRAPTPASAAFRGPGNLKGAPKARHCSKGRRKVRRGGKVRCLKRHRRHHGRAHR